MGHTQAVDGNPVSGQGHLHSQFWTGVPVAPTLPVHARRSRSSPPYAFPPASELSLPLLGLDLFSSLFHLGAFIGSSRLCWAMPSSSRKPSWLPQAHPGRAGQSPSHALHTGIFARVFDRVLEPPAGVTSSLVSSPPALLRRPRSAPFTSGSQGPAQGWHRVAPGSIR